MKLEQVAGRFINEFGDPVEGMCLFIPSRIWVDDEDGNSYPIAAPEVRLMNGRVLVYLTRTDTDDIPWYYTVTCPAGTWQIQINEDGPLMLKDLLEPHNA